jgi:branched-chain amino acid aminotransferase
VSIFYVDGQYVPAEKAVIPVDDLSILRGVGVFDFMRTFNGKPHHLKEHVARLENSARKIGLELPWSHEELIAIVNTTLEKNQVPEANIRIVITGGSSPDFITPQNTPRLLVMVTPIIQPPSEWYTNGIKIITVHTRRNLPEAKSIDYIRATIALREAKKAGAKEAVYLDREHYVLEGTTSNIFAIINGVLITPGHSILPGITRKIVLEISRSLMDHRVEKLSLSALYSAEEVFITGSGKGLVPVVQVDDHMIGDGRPGPKTKLLLEALALQKSNQDIP